MPSITFIPEIELDPDKGPILIQIKGQTPQLSYPFTMKEIWGTIPSLQPLSAYQRISKEFNHIDQVIAQDLHLRPSRSLPPTKTANEATTMMAALFNPGTYFTDDLWNYPIAKEPIGRQLLQVETALPFPLRQASKKKLLHTLAWIDCNIKIKLEKLARQSFLSSQAIIRSVKSALIIYCLLAKQQDFQLARSINFNHSMFLQDRILNLILGDTLYITAESLTLKGANSNRMALELLKGLPELTIRQLCLYSIFMGVIWTNTESMQASFINKSDETLAGIDDQLKHGEDRLLVDDINTFVEDLSASQKQWIAVILDDNGESVFDIALFQRLLEEIETLHVSFIVNRFPVSNNISEETFRAILEDDFFSSLAGMVKKRRANIVLEQQVFRSFEMEYLNAETLRWIRHAAFLYVKGANFFETFQTTTHTIYYAFTVFGEMCMTLTGYSQGSGIFARISKEEVPFIYHNPAHIVPLKDLIENRISQGVDNAG